MASATHSASDSSSRHLLELSHDDDSSNEATPLKRHGVSRAPVDPAAPDEIRALRLADLAEQEDDSEEQRADGEQRTLEAQCGSPMRELAVHPEMWAKAVPHPAGCAKCSGPLPDEGGHAIPSCGHPVLCKPCSDLCKLLGLGLPKAWCKICSPRFV